jgi:hypothetical protein
MVLGQDVVGDVRGRELVLQRGDWYGLLHVALEDLG